MQLNPSSIARYLLQGSALAKVWRLSASAASMPSKRQGMTLELQAKGSWGGAFR